MSLLDFMFRSLYDQYALVIMAAGLLLNVAADIMRLGRTKRGEQ
jgi:hypothetical protein